MKSITCFFLGLLTATAFAGYSSDPISCKIILRENSIVTNTTIIGADIEDQSNDSVVFEGNEIVFAGSYK